MTHLIVGTDNNNEMHEVKVSQTGNLYNQSIDSAGNSAFNGVFGERYVALRRPKFSANFNYPVDTRDSGNTVANGGTVGIISNLLTLQTGTNVAGTAAIQTKGSLRYSAGRDAETMFTGIFTTGKANSYQRCGLFDVNDGFFIGFEGVNFGVGIRKNASDKFIKQNDFNSDKLDGTGPSGFVYDHTKLNIFRIVYGYLGIAPVTFQIYSGRIHGWITFHIYDVVNKQAETHIQKPYLPIRAEVGNTGNNTNIKFESGSVYAGTIDGSGTADASSREFTRTLTVPGITTGTDKLLIAFHNKATFGGTQNKVDDLLLKLGLATEGTKTVKIALYKLAVAPTGGTWSDVDTTNSNMETNTTCTINLTGAQTLDAWTLGKTDSTNVDVIAENLLLRPDEYACFTYTSTGTSDVEFVNRWSELF